MPIRNKVQPGERRILADEYNAFLAMTQQAKLGIGSSGFSDFYQASRAYVKNTTAAKVNAFEVLALDSPVITRQENNPEFFGAPTFNGVTPDIDDHAGRYAILQEPAMPGDTVRAVIAGATWAWLNIIDENDTAAEIDDGVTSYLKTGADGTAKILWKEAGTGTGKAGLVYVNIPSSKITWFILSEPLYPRSDLSPYNNAVWSAQGKEAVWNDTYKRWDQKFPVVEQTIYSTNDKYGMTGMAMPCQKAGDGWEPVASAPGDDVVLRMLAQLSGDATSTLSNQGLRFEETSTTPTEHRGHLRCQTAYDRFAYQESYFQRPIDIGWANPSLDFETDGEIEVLFTGVYEITFAAEVTASLSTSPTGRKSNTTGTTGPASAGTAHTHTYTWKNPWDGYNKPVYFRPAMWRRPVAGSFAEQTGNGWRMPEIALNIVGADTMMMSYFGRIVMLLTEGETLGVEAVCRDLAEARCDVRWWTLGFHLLQPGYAS